MKKKLTSLVAALCLLANLFAPVIVVAESLTYKDMDGYQMKQNWDGSKTIRLGMQSEQQQGAITPFAMTAAAPNEQLEQSGPSTQVESQINSVYTKNQTLVTIAAGDTSVSFAPIMLEGMVVVYEQAENESPIIEEPPAPAAGTPVPSSKPETTEETTETSETTTSSETTSEGTSSSSSDASNTTSQGDEPTDGDDQDEEPVPTSTPIPTVMPEATDAPEITEDTSPTPTPSPSPSPTPLFSEEVSSPEETESTTEATEDAMTTVDSPTTTGNALKTLYQRVKLWLGAAVAVAEEEAEASGENEDEIATETTEATDESPTNEPATEEAPLQQPTETNDGDEWRGSDSSGGGQSSSGTVSTPVAKYYRIGGRTTVPGSGSGDSMYFTGLFDEVTDVRIRKLENGIKEDIIINEYIGGHVFSYAVNLNGLTPVQDGGIIRLYDETGVECGQVEAPYMFDAAGATSGSIGVSLGGSGGSYTLTYAPSDAWLADEGRVYPVTVDPSTSFHNRRQKEIEENNVSSKNPDSVQGLINGMLRVGNDGTSTYYAYYRIAVPDELREILSSSIIENAVHQTSAGISPGTIVGNGVYGYHPVLSAWTEGSITYNTRPKDGPAVATISRDPSHRGTFFSVDITAVFASYFNTMDQQENFGFVIKEESGEAGKYMDLLGFRSGLQSFGNITITYWDNVKDTSAPDVRVTESGNGPNSHTGAVTLNWEHVEGIGSSPTYYVGIFNGQEYEYIYVGEATSFTTAGRGLWPSGDRYKLHLDGGGGELPMFPTDTYAKAGGDRANDPRYFFVVVPANQHGQAPNPGLFEEKSARLPDTIEPYTPTDVKVLPGSSDNTRTLSWSGILDIDKTGETESLGTGCVQYKIEGPGEPGTWTDATGEFASAASGSCEFSVAHLAASQYTLHVRGVDSNENIGESLSCTFSLDRTPPAKPTAFSVSPATWTNADSIALSWRGITDAGGLARVEYQLEGKPWEAIDVQDADKDDFALAVTGVEGDLRISLRGVDTSGNEGEAAHTTLYLDRTAPTVGSASVTPTGWTNAQSVNLAWANVADVPSGLSSMEARLNNGSPISLSLDEAALGNTDVNIGNLADGTYPLALTATDKAGNMATQTFSIAIDRTSPAVALTSPAADTTASGIVEVWGSAQDTNLQGWTVTATGENGVPVPVASGTDAVNLALLGRVNTAGFADGERLHITLEVTDAAGNMGTSSAEITVDNQAKPLPGKVVIQEPASGQILKGNTQGQYEAQHDAEEAYTNVYVDGALLARCDGDTGFQVRPVQYDENSLHTITAITVGRDGSVHFSGGLGESSLVMDAFEDALLLSDDGGLAYSQAGAAGTGTLVSETLSPGAPILALYLEATQTGTTFEYNAGAGWASITPGQYAVLDTPAESVQVRAHVNGTLQGWHISAVTEMNPSRFVARVAGEVGAIEDVPEAAQAVTTPLLENEAAYQRIWQFVGKEQVAQDGTLNALRAPEGGNLSVVVVGLDAQGNLHASGGASVETLCRQKSETANTEIVQKLEAGKDLYAIRVVTDAPEASLSYSLDGSTWLPLGQDGYEVFSQAAQTVWVKAANITPGPFAWHIEGIAADELSVSAALLLPPEQVIAKDYGAFPAGQRKVVLSWTDPNPPDDTMENEHKAVILKNGEILASTDGTSWEDEAYEADAVYQVYFERVYAGVSEADGFHPVRTTAAIDAVVEKVAAPEAETADDDEDAEEEADPPAADPPPARKYVFAEDLPPPPSAEKQLDAKLLGKNKYCALGFEPINFNTGNFLLEAQDIYLGDIGQSSLDVMRTYNNKSDVEDGLFGPGWAFTYDQSLQRYADGAIGYRRADGATLHFARQANGRYAGNDDDFLSLAYDADTAQYHVTQADGIVHTFDDAGRYIRISYPQGYETSILYDENGRLSAVVAPSGARLRIATDDTGRITSIAAPDGLSLQYTYEDGRLAAVQDSMGAATRYEYGAQGWMTTWYDANGVCQAYNEYDDEGRVLYQKDALGGEYTLTYYDDYTVTVDAEGKRNEIYFDAQKRVTRMVGDSGTEAIYTYNAQGTIDATTDRLGQLTTYYYDERGNTIRKIAPNGAEVRWAYDEHNRLTALTDQNGNETTYAYDDRGNLISQVNADGGVLSYTYNEKGQKTSETDALGNTTQYEYAGPNMVRKVDALGNETRYAYDAGNRVNWMRDALGHETRYQYDAKGNLTMVLFADGTKASYTYDAMGNMTGMTDMLGNKTTYAYNPLGQLTRTVYPDKTEETRTYTASYQLASVTNAMGETETYTYDAAGNKTSSTDALGNVTTYAYDEEDRLIQSLLPTGVGSTYEYDNTTGLVSAITNRIGLRFTLTYDLAANLLAETKPNGAATLTRYDSMNRPVEEISPTGGVTKYTYDLAGQLVSVALPLGGTLSFAYDAAGNLIHEADATGYSMAYAYDALNRLVQTTDAEGAQTHYGYDATGNLISVTDALGNTQTYGYDANGRMEESIDPLGASMRIAYDKGGNITGITQKDGGKLTAAYDKVGRLTAETDALGNAMRYDYDALGRMTAVADALGGTAGFTYDVLGNMTRIIRPDGHEEQFYYDAAGRLIRTIDAMGAETENAYDALGNLVSMTAGGQETILEYDRAGNMTAIGDTQGTRVLFTYDAAGNLRETLYPDGTKDITTYDEMGRIVREEKRDAPAVTYGYTRMGRLAEVRQGERVTRYTYDLLGHVVAITLPDGSETQYRYDPLGNIIAQTDALGNTTLLGRDAMSRLAQVTDPLGATYAFAYDLAGNLREETDALGNKTRYAYDKLGRLTQVTDALGSKTRYTYDAQDNLTSVTDALGHITAYEYNPRGQVTAETDVNGHTERYAYTVDGLLAELTRPDGTKVTNTYDETGSLVAQQAGGKTVLQQDYTEQGRRVITTGTDGQSTYQFNGNNQLTSATYPTGDTVQYAYDEYGRKTGITYPDGSAIQYAYDQMDRLSSVTEANGSITRYSYNALGQRTEETREGQSLRTTYAYDAAGNLLRQETQGNTALSFGYAYDALGRMVKEERTEGGARLTSEYRYDKLGQLLEMTASDGYAEAYQYDAAGNMVRKQADGVRYSMRYGKANELTELRAGNQKLVYSYDENGNLREKALGGQTDQYTYDGLGNLSSYTGYDGYAQSYAYAGLGIRTEKQEKGNGNRLTLEEVLAGKSLDENITQGATAQGNASKNSESWTKTSYIQDVTQPHAQVLMEQTGGSTTSYVYGLDRLAGYTREADGNTLTTEYVYDGRGSVAQILTTGEVKAPEGAKPAATLLETLSLRYSPFGEQISATDSGSKTKASVSGYGYNGEAYDAATGMLHLRARQYEPAMNRFSQKDLVWGHVRQPLTQNRYAYVTNDPVNLIDPSGMWIADPADDSVRIRVNSQTGVSYSASSAKTPTDALTAADIPYLSERGLLSEPESYSSYYSDDSPYYSSSYTRSAADIAYAKQIRERQEVAKKVSQANSAKAEVDRRMQALSAQGVNLSYAEKKVYEDAMREIKNLDINKAEDAVKISQILMAACRNVDEISADRDLWSRLENAYDRNDTRLLPSDAELRANGIDPEALRNSLQDSRGGYREAYKDLAYKVLSKEEKAFVEQMSSGEKEFYLTIQDHEMVLLSSHASLETDRMQMLRFLMEMREGIETEQFGGYDIPIPPRVDRQMLVAAGIITAEEGNDPRFDALVNNLSVAYNTTLMGEGTFPYLSNPGELARSEAWDFFYLNRILKPEVISQNGTEYIEIYGGKAEKPVYGDGYYDQMEKNILEGNPVSTGTGWVWESGQGNAADEIVGGTGLRYLNKVKTNKGNEIDFTNASGKQVHVVEPHNSKNVQGAINSALASENPGKQVEGKVGQYITEQGKEVIGFGMQLENAIDKTKAGDFDVMTTTQLFEAKSSIGAVDVDQILKYVDPSHENYINYAGNEVIVYIDKPIDMLDRNALNTLNELSRLGVTYVNSLEELGKVLR